MHGHVCEVTPTIDTAIYASGDRLGTVHTLAGVCSSGFEECVLATLVITDASQQKAALDIFFFDELPTVISADNAAANVSDANVASMCVGHVVVATADYRDIGTANSTACIRSVGLTMRPAKVAATLYALVVSRGTPTYVAAGDLAFKYAFQW